MTPLKTLALILIAGGMFGLAYGGLSYIKDTHRADIGPLHVKVDEKQQVDIPLWISIGAIGGGILILVSSRKG